MANKTAVSRKATKAAPRTKKPGVVEQRQELLIQYLDAESRRKKGASDKKLTQAKILSVSKDETLIHHPHNDDTYIVVDKPGESNPRASAWDALLNDSGILTDEQVEQAEALLDSMTKPTRTQNIKKV